MQALGWEDRYTSIRMDKGKSRQVDEPDTCTCTCDSGYSSPAHSSTSSSSSSSVPGLSYSPSLSGSAADSQEGTFRAALFEDGQDDWNYTSSCCDDSYLPRDRRKALSRTSTQSHPLAASSESQGRSCIGAVQQMTKPDRNQNRTWSDWLKGISLWDRQKPSEKATESHPVAYAPAEEDKIHAMVQMQVMPVVPVYALPEILDSPSSLVDSWEDGCTDTCHLEEASGYSQTPYRILVNTDLYLMSALENVMMERRKIRAPLKQRGYVERPWQCSVSSPLRVSTYAA